MSTSDAAISLELGTSIDPHVDFGMANLAASGGSAWAAKLAGSAAPVATPVSNKGSLMLGAFAEDAPLLITIWPASGG